jgi:hypothetical protein
LVSWFKPKGNLGPEAGAVADLLALVDRGAVAVDDVVPILVADALLEAQFNGAGLGLLGGEDGAGGMKGY